MTFTFVLPLLKETSPLSTIRRAARLIPDSSFLFLHEGKSCPTHTEWHIQVSRLVILLSFSAIAAIQKTVHVYIQDKQGGTNFSGGSIYFRKIRSGAGGNEFEAKLNVTGLTLSSFDNKNNLEQDQALLYVYHT